MPSLTYIRINHWVNALSRVINMELIKNKIKVIAFGMVAEKMQTAELQLEGIPSTDVLRGYLYQQYPGLEGIKFGIAINKKLTSGNQIIPHEAEIALLPPFSGG
ncbi:molybdopterin converting factor, subunit 1 [Cecembia lonarensis LW9]|uniref:Molybdopterin converting factor, subunit 1 n=2 Tax=Cecembia TaxID=1187078 RepID=K1L6I8_CECL9|nr:molybdopterin converting factor, subunit 1 [Cecembia lonarensis LW9]